MNKNQKKITATVSGLAAAATVAISSIGIMSMNTEELNYSINAINQYRYELTIDEPKSESIDKVELYCNDGLVDYTLLPDGSLNSVPLIFSNLDNLKIKMYKQGEEVGSAKFDENGKLIYKH